MPSVTITRALSKIKILTDMINNDIKNNVFITTVPNSMLGSEEHTTLVKTLTSSHTSLEDKIKEIVKLKRLIAESNLTSYLEVSGKRVSVTEALAMKETMEFYSRFMITLRKQNNRSAEEVTHTNMRIAQAIAGNTSDISSNSDIKNEDLEKRLALNAKQLQESMGIKVVSATKETPEQLIESIKDYYNDFVSEIDYLLSEHNAVTTIELV